MLQLAAAMDLSASAQGESHALDVQITNETGHKLPSGYPEGRRIWINVSAYDSTGLLIYESGAYDTATAVLTHDPDVKIYQIKPGISTTLSPIVGETAGPSFHFVLNDSIYSDNRIPPRGFTNANFEAIQSPPVGYPYPDGQYWDNTGYTLPGAAAKVVVVLYYQTTSKEYIEFLRDENETDHWSDSIFSFWSANGKSLPVAMQTDSLALTPIAPINQPPIIEPVADRETDENVPLQITVSASDADGTTPALTTSALPGSAAFVDHGDGTGQFDWTPGYDDAGVYDVYFYASDTEGAADTDVVVITVNNINRAPVLTTPGAVDAAAGEELVTEVTASDPDGTIPALSALGLPAGATFEDSLDGSGWLVWTPAVGDTGLHSVTIVASDMESETTDLLEIMVYYVEDCCLGIRGNIDNEGEINVSDLTYLVSFLFQGGADPACSEEADVDASGAVNVSDLTYLVAYLFQGGPEPLSCPVAK